MSTKIESLLPEINWLSVREKAVLDRAAKRWLRLQPRIEVVSGRPTTALEYQIKFHKLLKKWYVRRDLNP